MQILAPAESRATAAGKTEVIFRRILVAFSVVAALGLLGHLGMVLWAQNAFTGGESVVAAHTMMLAHEGTLYYDLNRYPYTVSPYTPLFYLLDAGLQKLGLAAYTAGRAISFLALLGIVALSWKLALIYTGDRYTAWMSALLCASSTLMLVWGTVGQVDVLAVCLTLAAFYLYSRYAIRGENTLLWCGVCVVLAFFTKQTIIACPAAICLLLWFTHRKAAMLFGGACLTAVAVVSLSLDKALGGRFLADTVSANMNPYSTAKLLSHLRAALLTAGPLMLVAGLGARKVFQKIGYAPLVYLGVAGIAFLASAPKTGSDLNYQLEFTVLLILGASLSLHALDFFRLSFLNSRTWVTLLQLPLGVFLVVNCRSTGNVLLMRFVNEQQTRTEVTALKSTLADGGRVISADFNAMVRLRGRLEVEMVFYKLLVDTGLVDPEPLRRDLAATAFSTVILWDDLRNRETWPGLEISTLPEAQLEEIRKHYRLVKHIPGPVLNGVYVYKPNERSFSE